MFDLFRSRDKAVRYLLGALLGLVALSMVITLIPGYGTPSQQSDQVVAEIDGEPLTVRQVQGTIQSALRNRQVPPEMIQHYVPQLVDQMITERAVAYQAKRMGFRVSDEDVATAIRSMLTQLFPDGKFDRAVYERFLGQQGLSVAEFEKNIRTNLMLLRLQNVALEGTVVTPQEIESEFKRKNDQVRVDYVAYSPSKTVPTVTITPQEVEDYYKAHKNTYTVPEKRTFHLLIADEAKMAAGMEIPEAELRRLYQTSLDKFRSPDRANTRHILIKTLDKPKDEIAKLKAKVEDLLKQARAGADFAQLATKNSEDTVSAAKGGSLDWVTRDGQMVKPFEDAVFALKPNEISNVVETQYGFHIIQVLAKEQARVKPFEEVRAQLASEQQKQFVFDRMQQAIDQARGELVKNSQQAQLIASKYNLTYARAENIGRGESIPEVGTSAEVEQAALALKPGEASPTFQVGANKLGIVSLISILPARPAEFAEVAEQVRSTVTNNKVQGINQQRAKEALDKLKAATDLKAIAQSMGLEVKSTSAPFTQDAAAEGIGPASYILAAFAKPAGSLVGPVTIGDQIFLVRVAEKLPADLSKLAAERETLLTNIKRKKAQERKDLFEDGLMTELIKEGKVKKNADAIKRISTAYQG